MALCLSIKQLPRRGRQPLTSKTFILQPFALGAWKISSQEEANGYTNMTVGLR